MALRNYYGDEAGNTGPDLLDAAQPVFALAFTDFTREEATELLSTVSTKADEVHLADMLRRKGRSHIDRCLIILPCRATGLAAT